MTHMSYFIPPIDQRKFTIWESIPISTIISILNAGRISGIANASIHAGPKGYRIKIDGRTIARGSTPVELVNNFQAAQEKARAATGGAAQ